MTAILLIFLLLSALLLPINSLGCSNNKIIDEESRMIDDIKIPPIDAAVPTEIEKATFALG